MVEYFPAENHAGGFFRRIATTVRFAKSSAGLVFLASSRVRNLLIAGSYGL
ncbi:hypothetical protein LINGRAHAP2_LOCUS8981 [Linum grandiflorum]